MYGSGEHFWDTLEPFCITTAKGNKDWWDHGTGRVREGESWVSLANPLLWAWTRWMHKCILLCLEMHPLPPAEMEEAHHRVDRAVQAGILPKEFEEFRLIPAPSRPCPGTSPWDIHHMVAEAPTWEQLGASGGDRAGPEPGQQH